MGIFVLIKQIAGCFLDKNHFLSAIDTAVTIFCKLKRMHFWCHSFTAMVRYLLNPMHKTTLKVLNFLDCFDDIHSSTRMLS